MKWYFQKYKGFLLIEAMMTLLVMSIMSMTYYQTSLRMKQIKQDYHDELMVLELMINIETRRLFNEIIPIQYDRYGHVESQFYYELIKEETYYMIIRIKDQMEMTRWSID